MSKSRYYFGYYIEFENSLNTVQHVSLSKIIIICNKKYILEKNIYIIITLIILLAPKTLFLLPRVLRVSINKLSLMYLHT